MAEVQLDPAKIPTPSSPRDLTLPLADYVWTEHDHFRVLQAHELLIDRCAKRFGIRYTAPPAILADASGGDPFNRLGRYGHFNRDWAAAHGTDPEPDPAVAAAQGTKRDSWRPDRLEQLVVTGGPGAEKVEDFQGRPVPEGGCSKESERALSSDTSKAPSFEEVQRLEKQTWDRSRHHPLVEAAGKQWVACMTDKGYAYKDHWNFSEQPAPPRESKSAEIARAVADVDCRIAANLIGVWNAVEAEMQRQALEADPDKYAAIRASKDDQLRRAKDLLAGDSE